MPDDIKVYTAKDVSWTFRWHTSQEGGVSVWHLGINDPTISGAGSILKDPNYKTFTQSGTLPTVAQIVMDESFATDTYGVQSIEVNINKEQTGDDTFDVPDDFILVLDLRNLS